MPPKNQTKVAGQTLLLIRAVSFRQHPEITFNIQYIIENLILFGITRSYS